MSQYDPRITAYFGDAVLQAGFMPVPHLVLRHYRQLGLSHVQLVFVLQLMEIAWDIAHPPTTVARLAERMDVTDRAIRKWSQELMDSGLIRIYDQYDSKGTQVENAYDLSPLFHRLAALAPVQRPPGELRQRRARAGNHDPDASQPLADVVVGSMATPSKAGAPSRNGGSSSPRNDGSSSSGTVVPPLPAPPFSGQRNNGAGLKEESRKGIKKQQKRLEQQQPEGQQRHGGGEQSVAAVPQFLPGTAGGNPEQADRSGRSLRWQEALSAAEVQQSQDVLLRLGVNAPVARAGACSLHPAEAWSLWCYARGAELGPAWVAQQIYDARQQRPLLTAQARLFDPAGRRLALLDGELAAALIDHVLAAAGRMPGDPAAQPRLVAALAGPDASQIAEAITSLEHAFAAQRGGQQRRPTGQPDLVDRATAPHSAAVVPAPDARWLAACAQLAQVIAPDDCELWLRPLVVLDSCADRVVVGAPNVFVRDEVRNRFLPELAAAVGRAWGQEVALELAIASKVDR